MLLLIGRSERYFRTGLCFTRDVFSFFFRQPNLRGPWPIAAKLCHMIGIWVEWPDKVQKFGVAPLKTIGDQKHAKFWSAVPPPQKIFLNFYIKMVSSGAFWVAISYRLAAYFI